MNHPAPRSVPHLSRWSHFWIFIVIVCLAVGSVRLVYIQQVLSPELLAYKDRQQTRFTTIAPQRGMVLDTRGRILAVSTTRASVFVDPQQIADLQATCGQLATILDVDASRMRSTIQQRSDKQFVWIARKISNEEAHAIRSLELTGVHVTAEAQRTYPNGSLLAHVLGFVNIDTQGQEGVERQYNEALSGVAGHYSTSCDARRQPLKAKNEDYRPAQNGQHVVLTVDVVIQEFAETALRNAVHRFEAASGIAIVMSPQTGDLLAMCCYPTFDPNFHQGYAADAKRNRCLTDPVEPGSIFKPFIIASALARGTVQASEHINCGEGVWYFGKRRIRDTHANGVLTLENVLVKSSNIGMGKIGTRMGNNQLHQSLTSLGFGRQTGITLPAEGRGILLPVRKWNSYSKTSVPMGQEVAVTPLQLMSAFATLANHGRSCQPRIVRTLLAPDGAFSAMQDHPQAVEQVLPAGVADLVARRMMVRMVSESHHDIQLQNHQMLGKTGTAQVPYSNRRGYEPQAYLASFIGAAPAHNPMVAALIMIRKPNSAIGYYGGQVAGPAVRDIIAQSLAYWNIAGDSQPAEGVAMYSPQ